MSFAIVSLPEQLPSDPTVLSEQKMQSSALLTAHPPCLSNVMHLVLLMLFPRKKTLNAIQSSQRSDYGLNQLLHK